MEEEYLYEIKCPVCNDIFKDRESLQTHEIQHLEYKCEFCDKAFFKLSFLKRHQNNAHKPSLNVLCVICKNTFRSNYNLKQHLLTHSEKRKYECLYENCTQTFRQISALQSHQKIHRNENREKCPECGLLVTKLSKYFFCNFFCKFNLKFNFTESHLLTHSTVRPFKCNFKKCESSFTTNQQLKAHQDGKHKSVKGNTLQCDQCEAKFSFKSSLYKHKTSIHSKNKILFECSICKKQFNRKDNLFHHTRNVHILVVE